MPYWRNFGHLVWATKNREPLIRPAIEGDLYSCLVDKAAELGCYVHAVNGLPDHVHVILSIPPKHSVANVVKHLKGNSSHFVNHALPAGPDLFAWQRGYGYLSLGETQLARAVAYVENQKQHHKTNTTNSWLEKIDDEEEDDSGPQQPPIGVIRENQAVYVVDDEIPF